MNDEIRKVCKGLTLSVNEWNNVDFPHFYVKAHFLIYNIDRAYFSYHD